MGDIADWTNDCMQEANPGWMPAGGPSSRRRSYGPRQLLRERNTTACKFCGNTHVHWRDTSDGWRLYENERQHPGNRYIEHNCSSTKDMNTEGFDDVD